MNKDLLCLIITGCINPNSNVPVLSVKDGDLRRRQYIDSIRFYIEKTNFENIVFCENSGAQKDDSLEKTAKKNGKKFEWLSFSGDVDKAITKGKGFGEIEIINYAIAHSKLLSEKKLIFKVTGRLIIKNVNWFIRLGKPSVNYFMGREDAFVDTRCYCISRETFEKYFSQSGERVDDTHGVFLEHVFYKIISEENVEYRLFPIEPEFSGVSGSKGYSYDSPHYKNVTKSIIAYIKH